MIMQRTHLVVDCPTCGRPVEVHSEHVGHELACGHCRGHFVVYEAYEGEPTATKLNECNLLERADLLLQRAIGASDYASSDRNTRSLQLLSVDDGEDRAEELIDTQLEDDQCESVEQPTALLAEHRDEVFARIATDMAEFGMRVIRANSAIEALKLFGTYQPTMVVANVDLPDQNGWTLAGKIRFIDSDVRIWVYQPQSEPEDEGMAKWLEIDELLDYGGDLLGLSEAIIDLMADRREPSSAACYIERTKEFAAA